MKRRVMGILLTVVLAAGFLTGCGSGGAEENTGSSADAQETDAGQEKVKKESSGKAVEISWLHHFQE